ncbi:MAG: NADH-quinone oxidoreductase subunit J [Ignavibacteria bacterium]|nr:NADH-quinone oxidoreductase subunit J [Bacteroidota bacterium]MSQ46218.1 NADH-quinone oxidoreductase subunit J [Ignavibacteria bacterium]
MALEQIIFWSLILVAGFSAIMVVVSRSPITSALYLILNFFCLGGFYLTLNAQFIAIVHIIVYAGAIMVLFLFVIMLLNLGDESKLRERIDWKTYISISISVAFFVELYYILMIQTPIPVTKLHINSAEVGTVEYLGKVLYTQFIFPFELTSILLIAAIIGAIILAKKKFTI